MSPSYYQNGGAMLPPEAIANRRASAKGEEVVFKTNKDLINHIVDLSAQAGKNVTQAQKRRYEGMRRDQLEKLVSNLSVKKKAAPKKPQNDGK